MIEPTFRDTVEEHPEMYFIVLDIHFSGNKIFRRFNK
jgi:hypothetical protein